MNTLIVHSLWWHGELYGTLTEMRPDAGLRTQMVLMIYSWDFLMYVYISQPLHLSSDGTEQTVYVEFHSCV
jgi:hypothetical protein